MQCGVCGTAAPGEAASCPSCGHPISRGIAAPVVPVRAPLVSQGLIGAVVYAGLIFGTARYFAHLYAVYLDAEQERIEAGLLGQALERKKEMRLAEQEIEDADQATSNAEESGKKDASE